jgi:multidrug resistance efflux pump
MTDRRGNAGVFAICDLRSAILLAILLIAGLAACSRMSKDIETYRIEPKSFVRRVTAEGNLKAVKATPISAPQGAPGALKVAWIADDGTVLRKDQLVVRFDATEYEQLLLSGNEDRLGTSTKLIKTNTQARATSSNLRRDASQAQNELDTAKRFRVKPEDEEIFSRYQRIESEVDQALAAEKKSYAMNVLGVRETLVGADRDLLNIEDRKAGLKIEKAEQGLKATEVRAPHDGILVLQRDWRGEIPRVGSNLWSGAMIGEIPDLKEMKAEVFVLEADAAGLAVGQKATAWLESNSRLKFTGSISQVDKLARPRLRGVPVQFFGVTITLDSTDPKTMKPGSRVRAVLDVENRTNAIVIPRQALFEKEGKKIVYRRKGTGFEPVDVVVASSSAGRVVIGRGIIAGDEIALEDPTSHESR